MSKNNNKKPARITQEKLLNLFHYDRAAGTLRRKVRASSHAAGTLLGTKVPSGYHHAGVLGRTYRLTHLIWLAEFGVFPEGVMDHINGKPDDDRIENLRDVSTLENSRNRKMSKNNTSGYTGIHRTRIGRWTARINGENGRKITVGTFDTIEEAVSRRAMRAKMLGYSDTHGLK